MLPTVSRKVQLNAGAVQLAFRLPDNKRLQRRFRSSDTLQSVVTFLSQSGLDMQRHMIVRSFPRKVTMPCRAGCNTHVDPVSARVDCTYVVASVL